MDNNDKHDRSAASMRLAECAVAGFLFLLGVLVIERSHLNAFSTDDVALVQSVGRSISIALERAYQGRKLRFNASVAAATAWVADMAHDIKDEIGNIRYQTYRLKSRLAAELQTYVDEIDRSADLLKAYSYPPESAELLENLALDSWLDQLVARVGERQLHISYRLESRPHRIESRHPLVRRRIEVGDFGSVEPEITVGIEPDPPIEGRALDRHELVEERTGRGRGCL